jgi:cyclic pyranopterin phosphate synthase
MAMMNIADKKTVYRESQASGWIELSENTMELIKRKEIKKGDALMVAEITAIQAIKNTPNLIPHCHQILVQSVEVNYEILPNGIKVIISVAAFGQTGVEMEALTGVSIALLTLWDMVKYLEKDEHGQYPHTFIHDIQVDYKVKHNNE